MNDFNTKRPQITAVNHYDIFPFDHGGSLGIRGLYKALSEWVDVNIVTFVTQDTCPDEVMISNHVKVIPIVLPKELYAEQEELYKKYGMTFDTLIDSSPIVMRSYHKYSEIVSRVEQIAKDSIIVIAEHVFSWRIIKTACPDKHLWYRANNVEYDYKSTTYEVIGSPQELLDETYEFEKRCCEECEKVMTVSQLEADRFMELYRFPEDMKSRFMDIRSGYDTDAVMPLLPSLRKPTDGSYDFSGLYIASNTPNALEAAKACFDIARNFSNIKIYVVGRISEMLKNYTDIPDNIEITGVVTDEKKVYLLSHCDFALNLMEAGAGINVKMFEYFAYGIPVIATNYGARGINVTPGKDIIITSMDDYLKDFAEYISLPVEKKDYIARNARTLLEDQYSWRSLGRRIVDEIDKMYGYHLSENALPLEEIALYDYDPSPSLLPDGNYYIRCAGKNGRKFLDYALSMGKIPEAFVECNKKLIGKKVKDVKVISLDDYISYHSNVDIVVAVWDWFEIVADLLERGIEEKHIYVSWGGTGDAVFRFSDLKGQTYRYCDPSKWKKIVKEFIK